MKKAFLAVAMMISFLSFSFAQTATTTTKVEKHASHKRAAAKSTVGKVKSAAKETKADIKDAANDAKSAAKEPTKSSTTGNVRLKKDGTPDRRFKANKKS